MKNKLLWYANRLSLMSPGEIGFRIAEAVRKTFEEGKAAPRVKSPEFRPGGVWYLDLSLRDAAAAAAAECGWTEEKALSLYRHELSFFSFDRKYLGQEIDWHRDYKNNRHAPLDASAAIDYRDFQSVGDIKYIWELNRHQHLVPLAKAFYLTGKAEYRKEVESQLESWINANPCGKGVNWESSLELAIRLISWSWVWRFLDPVPELLQRKWADSIYLHCHRLSRRFSRYSSANNHLIGEAAGLYIAGWAWPYWDESAKWREQGYRVLVEEMEKQNFPDGVNREQALSYQRFVMDFFILAALLGRRNGQEFPPAYWARMEKMLEFLGALTDRGDHLPNIGDADDGFAVTLADTPGSNASCSLLATGAVLFGRPEFKFKARTFDEKSLWLLGPEGRAAFGRLVIETAAPGFPRSFPEGGYYILSVEEETTQEIKCVFDCGPLGYLSLAAHGHADALSLTLSSGGREFLIDPGTYAYHSQKEWRDYFRGTSAHNTIRVDSQDQSVSGGTFMWLKKANARSLRFEDNEDLTCVTGEHDGYLRLPDPVRHQREVVLDKKRRLITITDRLFSRREHKVEQFFHLASDCSLKMVEPNQWQVTNGGRTIRLVLDAGLKPELYSGSLDPRLGWQSRRFDIKEKTFTLVNQGPFSGDKELVTLIHF